MAYFDSDAGGRAEGGLPRQPATSGLFRASSVTIRSGWRSRLPAVAVGAVLLALIWLDGVQAAGLPAAVAAAPVAATAAPAPKRATSPLWRGLRAVLRVALASYLGLMLYMFLAQSKFVFFPSGPPLFAPSDVGLEYEEVVLEVGEADTIHGWFVPVTEGERGVVLFCHGNAGNIGDRFETIAILHGLGFSTLIFDYRGYGRSTGRASEKNCYADAEAMWDYLTTTRGVSAQRIVVFGRSLGGGVASWLAAERTPGALVLESTFTSIADLGQEIYPFIPVRLLSRIRFDTAKRLPKIRCPVIVIHSPRDDVIPYHHGKRLFELAPEPKTFIELSGDHNEGFLAQGDAYINGLDEALAGTHPRPVPASPAGAGQ